MNKRLAAGFLAAASTASVLGVTAAATPANAAVPCGTYPPGQAYALARVPSSGNVHRNTLVYTRATLSRGDQFCNGFPLGFYVAQIEGVGVHDFRLQGGKATDETGSVHIAITAGNSFRYYYQLKLNATTVIPSLRAEILVR